MNLTVIGIGRLGLSLALLFEKAGFNVCGVDVNLKYVDNLVKLFGPRNIFGRSVVIHALPDDLGLQGTLINEQFVEYKNLPDRDLQILCGQRNYKDIKTKTQMINKLNKESKSTGNAGQRIAYAIIGISK